MRTFVVVKTLVMNEAGEVLLLRRSNTDVNRPLEWDLPGGMHEPDEDLNTTALRETREEAGLTLKSPTLIWAKSEIREFGSGTWLFFFERVVGRPNVCLSHEHCEFAWMPLDDARRAISYHLHLEFLFYVKRNNPAGAGDVPFAT